MAKGIKEAPINIKDYYRELKLDYKQKISDCEEKIETAKRTIISIKPSLNTKKNWYKKVYKIDLDLYNEFVEDRFINGELLDKANYIYRNAKDDASVADSINLVKYASALKVIQDCNKNLEKYNKIVNFTYEEFKHYIRTFYMEVQRQMIVNGYGYEFSEGTGTVVINRCKINIPKTLIDTKATKRNIEKLRAEGKEIYDEKKANYYKEHGLVYNAIDPRVYRTDQFCYEFCLIYSRLKHSFNYKFEPYDYWSPKLRGKTKEDFISEAKNNLSYICGLDITFRTKVTICNEIDKTLYLKFIRNENQSRITTPKNHRKG